MHKDLMKSHLISCHDWSKLVMMKDLFPTLRMNSLSGLWNVSLYSTLWFWPTKTLKFSICISPINKPCLPSPSPPPPPPKKKPPHLRLNILHCLSFHFSWEFTEIHSSSEEMMKTMECKIAGGGGGGGKQGILWDMFKWRFKFIFHIRPFASCPKPLFQSE